jgi:8-oxo-dGTP diphosphatase
VAATEPVVLTEHDSHQWAALDGELPVTDAVKGVLVAYNNTRTG